MFAVLHGECALSEAVGEGKYTQRNDHILSHNSGLCSRAQVYVSHNTWFCSHARCTHV